MSTCNLCSTNITKAKFPGIKCAGACENTFHFKCANISEELLNGIKNGSANWLCNVCRITTLNQSLIVDEEDNSDETNNLPSLSDVMIQLKRMEKQLSTLENMKATVLSLASDNEQLTSRVNTLENQLSIQTSKIHLLEAEIDKPIQQLNSSSITIIGLPCQHDDIRDIVINTIKKIGVEITYDDIVSIHSIPKTTSTVSSIENKSKSPLHDLLIVKFTTNEIKNNILLQMKEKKSLFTKDLDVILPLNHPEQRIFIMQRLTAFQSKLYREAKKIKTSYNFKYLWCKNGQIYLRKSGDSDVHRIQSLNDIFRLHHAHDPKGSKTSSG